MRRLRNAKLSATLHESTLGETDCSEMCISSTMDMSMDELVDVLIHEYLHNWCVVRGKYMSCHREHVLIANLGDIYA